MARKWSFLMVVLIALMLAGCGGSGNPGGGGVTLSETYNANGLTFKYPGGWVVSPDTVPGGPVSVANNQAALDAAASDAMVVASGQQMILILPFGSDVVSVMNVTSPLALLQQMVPSISGGEGGLTFGDPAETTIGGKPAARASGSGDGGDGQLIAIDMGDAGYALVMGATGKGEMGNLEGTLNGVAESVSITGAG